MGTILILRLGDIIMKVIILLCAVVAAVSANAVPNTCQVQKNLVDKLSKEASKHYPPGTKGDGVCEDEEGFGCIGEITSAIATCVIIMQGHFDADLVACMQEIIGAAGDCYDCICWTLNYLGYNCACPEF